MNLWRFIRKLLRAHAGDGSVGPAPLGMEAATWHDAVEAHQPAPRHMEEPRGRIVEPPDRTPP